jgi:hypothetical protein
MRQNNLFVLSLDDGSLVQGTDIRAAALNRPLERLPEVAAEVAASAGADKEHSRDHW